MRAEIKNGTELGKTAKGYIDQGQLIPDELMIDIPRDLMPTMKGANAHSVRMVIALMATVRNVLLTIVKAVIVLFSVLAGLQAGRVKE